MQELFFTSDTHFGHNKMAEIWRGFYSREEMDEVLIQRWNETVAPTDTVWHLGDLSFYSKTKTLEVINRLHGHINLIFGNHDSSQRNWLNASGRFDWTGDYKELKIGTKDDRQRLILFHFPIESWRDVQHRSWHLHGHCHGNLPETPMARLDVGVDTHELTPWHYDEVVQALETKKGLPNDHHGGERWAEVA